MNRRVKVQMGYFSLSVFLHEVEVFVQYYSKCPPGMCFSQEIVNSLLSSLLNLGLLRKFVDVINLLLTHNSLVSVFAYVKSCEICVCAAHDNVCVCGLTCQPSPEIVLAAFKHVRDRGLIDYISELTLLTSKVRFTFTIYDYYIYCFKQ